MSIGAPSTSDGRLLVRLALFPSNTLPRTSSDPPPTNRPPPSANRPFGATAVAVFPVTRSSTNTRAATCPVTAPPMASLPMPAAEFPESTLFVIVSAPQVSIPPPVATAYGQGPVGHGGPNGAVSVGVARLPTIALLVIVTVAPGRKPSAGGTSMPPPAAYTFGLPANGTDSGLDVETPPVMVTPSIETVGSEEAPNVPIVSTEPPPRIVVASTPAPRKATLFVIVTPPAKVPRPRAIVSPSCAASSAA